MKKITYLIALIFFSINPLLALDEDIIFTPDKTIEIEKDLSKSIKEIVENYLTKKNIKMKK